MNDSTAKVTRDIVLDLLPVYESGEASADTRAAVEDFVRRDPALAAQLQRERQTLRLPTEPGSTRNEPVLAALVRTRSLLRRRMWLLAIAICFTALPLSIGGDSKHGITWFLLRDAPRQAAIFWLLAIGAWVAFFFTSRKLKPTEL